MVQEKIQSAEDLCGSWGTSRDALFDGVLKGASSQRASNERNNCRVRAMWSDVQFQAGCPQKRKESKILFQEMSPTNTDREGVSLMREEIHYPASHCSILQHGLLSKIEGGNVSGENGARGIGNVRTSISSRSSDWEIRRGFCSIGQGRTGSGRNILAQNEEGFRKAQRSCHQRGWSSTAKISLRSFHDGGSVAILPTVHSGTRPIASGITEIVKVERYTETDICYDLEIENDHTYVVGEQGLIVHNSDICLSLDGLVFNKNELDKWSPPNHHACRSVVVAVLTGEEFQFDRMPNFTREPGGFLSQARPGRKSTGE
mgnify:CR=1 FL=1